MTDDTTEMDPKCLALAAVLKVPADTCEVAHHDCFTSTDAPGEYRVLDEAEREQAADEALESYIDECILPECPEIARNYFDSAKWKRDALMSDGYGHTLSSYDGAEEEAQIDGVWYFIYRTN